MKPNKPGKEEESTAEWDLRVLKITEHSNFYNLLLSLGLSGWTNIARHFMMVSFELTLR